MPSRGLKKETEEDKRTRMLVELGDAMAKWDVKTGGFIALAAFAAFLGILYTLATLTAAAQKYIIWVITFGTGGLLLIDPIRIRIVEWLFKGVE